MFEKEVPLDALPSRDHRDDHRRSSFVLHEQAAGNPDRKLNADTECFGLAFFVDVGEPTFFARGDDGHRQLVDQHTGWVGTRAWRLRGSNVCRSAPDERRRIAVADAERTSGHGRS
jgi:hypothetical protein